VAGLLAPFAEGFRAELLGQGYTQGSAAHQIHLMAHLSRWLEAQGLEPAALDERVASQFAAARRADGYAAQLSAGAVMPLLGYLRALAVAAPRMPEPQAPGERLTGRFAGYLARERCLAADSIRGYTGVARRFLAEADVEGLTAADVTGFARRECGRRGVASAKATVTGPAGAAALPLPGRADHHAAGRRGAVGGVLAAGGPAAGGQPGRPGPDHR
jgi:hypothetical protein